MRGREYRRREMGRQKRRWHILLFRHFRRDYDPSLVAWLLGEVQRAAAHHFAPGKLTVWWVDHCCDLRVYRSKLDRVDRRMERALLRDHDVCPRGT